MPHLGVSFPESLDMALDEQQKLLNTGNCESRVVEMNEFCGTRFQGGRSQLSVTIVEVGGTPQPSPLSDRSSQQLLETPLDTGQLRPKYSLKTRPLQGPSRSKHVAGVFNKIHEGSSPYALGARRFDTAYIFGWFCSPQHHLLPRPQRRLLAHREPAEMGRSRPLRLPPAPEDRRQGHIPGASLQFPGASRQLEMLRLSHRRVSVFLALFPAPPRIHRVVKSTIDDRMNSRNCVKSPDRCFRK